MPEGDTVYLAAANMNAVLAGATLTRCDLRVPAFATVDLTGEIVHGVVSRGKHLLHRIGQWTVHSHLAMEGSWHLYRPDSRWRRPEWQARAVLGTADWVAVGFQLSTLEVVATVDENEIVGHLGPDLLGADWDAGLALANLRSDPGRPIALALMDQRNLAGIGNVYKNELCFLRGVLPARPVGEVADLEGLVALAKRLIEANKNRPDRTTTGTLRGETTWVYRRNGKPCRRCGTRIESTQFGEPGRERGTYWCPRCQS